MSQHTFNPEAQYRGPSGTIYRVEPLPGEKVRLHALDGTAHGTITFSDLEKRFECLDSSTHSEGDYKGLARWLLDIMFRNDLEDCVYGPAAQGDKHAALAVALLEDE